MIDAADSIGQIDARLARIEAERVSLVALRAAWENYLGLDTPADQPGHGETSSDTAASPAPVSQPEAGGSPPAAAPPVGSSPVVACPKCGMEVKPQGLGSHQRKHKPYAAGDPAADLRARTPSHGINPFEPGSVARAASAANERPPARPDPPRKPWVPEPVGTNPPAVPMHPRKEHWACNRCPAEFLTRQERDEHQATHPPIPAAEPMRRASRGAVDQVAT